MADSQLADLFPATEDGLVGLDVVLVGTSGGVDGKDEER
jgi:hypothetical protein